MVVNGLILALISIIWGSSFFLMKKGLSEFSPIEVATLRFAITLITVFPFFFSAIKSFQREKVPWLLIVALLGSGFPAILFAISISKVDSAIAGIINSMVPLFTLLFGVLLFRVKQKPIRYIGVFMGLIGAVILVFYNSEGHLRTNYLYALLPVAATVFYGINANVLKTKFNDIKPLHLISLMYFILGMPSLVYIFSSEIPSKLSLGVEVWRAFGAIALLAILGSAVAMAFFVLLLQRTSALFATTTTYLIPIVAVIWGLYDGEDIGLIQMLGMLFIFGGVYLVNKIIKPTELKQ